MTITVNWSETSDLDIYLYDTEWNLVASSCTLENPESITFTVTEAQAFYLEVSLYHGASVSYTLLVTHS